MWKAWLSPGSTLSVGHGPLDEAHQALFRLLERVYSQAFARSGDPAELVPELARRIHELCRALEEHFQAEEALMEEHGYPDRRVHRAAHGSFREEMAFVLRALERNELTPGLGARIAGEIPAWVETHIRTVDRPLGRFLAALDGGASGASPRARRAARRSRVD